MRRTVVSFCLVGGLALAGCNGAIGEPPLAGSGTSRRPSDRNDAIANTQPIQCNGDRQPDLAPLRLLSRAEYNNTVADLLGDTSAPLTVSPSRAGTGYSNDADSLSSSPRLVEHYMEVAATVADRAVARRGEIITCDPSAASCASETVRAIGTRAFRRPLTSTEQAALEALFAEGASSGGFDGGMKTLVETLLQSPDFLYHVEIGSPSMTTPGTHDLSDFEIASRLSYFLWSTMPDQELFDAAAAGALHEPGDIEAQARRMLTDTRAHDSARSFHTEWLSLDRLDSSAKDATAFPEFDASLRAAMKEETLSFLDDVLWNGGTVRDLFSSSRTFANAQLASLYGVVDAPIGSDLSPMALDPEQRSGLLTQASLLTILAKFDRTSPIHRGLFVRDRIMCQPLPPPPSDVPAESADTEGLPERERLAVHRENPACASCHNLIDPVGLAFESYDAIGRWRETEVDGAPVDSSGELTGAGAGVDGPVADAVELSQQLGDSPIVQQCIAMQWMRRALGRTQRTSDACTVHDVVQRFSASGYVLEELLVAITQTDAFRQRVAPDTTDVAGGCE